MTKAKEDAEILANGSLEDLAEQLVTQLKNLVESPYFDLNPVPVSQTKDIINGICERLGDWRILAQRDKARRLPTEGAKPGNEHLVTYLRALSLFS